MLTAGKIRWMVSFPVANPNFLQDAQRHLAPPRCPDTPVKKRDFDVGPRAQGGDEIECLEDESYDTTPEVCKLSGSQFGHIPIIDIVVSLGRSIEAS